MKSRCSLDEGSHLGREKGVRNGRFAVEGYSSLDSSSCETVRYCRFATCHVVSKVKL